MKLGNVQETPTLRTAAQAAVAAVLNLSAEVSAAGNPSEAKVLQDLSETLEYAYAPDFEEVDS